MRTSHDVQKDIAKALGKGYALIDEIVLRRKTLAVLNQTPAIVENQDYSLFIKMDFDFFAELSRAFGQMMDRVPCEFLDFHRIQSDGEPIKIMGFPVVVVAPSTPNQKVDDFKVVIEYTKNIDIRNRHD